MSILINKLYKINMNLMYDTTSYFVSFYSLFISVDSNKTYVVRFYG
jgi:hypothetical protein